MYQTVSCTDTPGIISPWTGLTASPSMQEGFLRAHLALVRLWPCTFTTGSMARMAASTTSKESPTTVIYTLPFMQHLPISASVVE